IVSRILPVRTLPARTTFSRARRAVVVAARRTARPPSPSAATTPRTYPWLTYTFTATLAIAVPRAFPTCGRPVVVADQREVALHELHRFTDGFDDARLRPRTLHVDVEALRFRDELIPGRFDLERWGWRV